MLRSRRQKPGQAVDSLIGCNWTGPGRASLQVTQGGVGGLRSECNSTEHLNTSDISHTLIQPPRYKQACEINDMDVFGHDSNRVLPRRHPAAVKIAAPYSNLVRGLAADLALCTTSLYHNNQT